MWPQPREMREMRAACVKCVKCVKRVRCVKSVVSCPRLSQRAGEASQPRRDGVWISGVASRKKGSHPCG